MKALHSSIFVAVAVLGGLFLGPGSASAQVWTLQTNVPALSVASSADGTKLVAVGGAIYTSSDSGVNWRLTTAPWTNWFSVASSADGTKLVAVVFEGGIYTSSDSGTNWTMTSAPSSPYENYWISVASSANGTKLVALTYYAGGIYTSSDSGTNWTLTSAPDPNEWSCVASSADGSKLVAGTANNIYYPGTSAFGILTSSDFGANWNQTSAPGADWSSVASSADGTKLVAVVGWAGISTSSDSGANWTPTSAPFSCCYCVASSADGVKLAAGGNNGQGGGGYIYTSTDSGTNWTQTSAPINVWSGLASSADGSKLVAVVEGGGIYTFDAPGSLQVTITPAAAVSAGAEWRMNGGAFQVSGATVTNLSPTNVTVSFKSISGWAAPANQTVTIIAGQTTNLVVAYLDTTKPTLSIVSPKAGMTVSNAAFTVTGTASDNWQVTNVFYSLNSGGWSNAVTANNWSNWTAAVTLIPGTNTIAAYAVDTSGNDSTTSNASLFNVVSNQLQIRATGLGTISPNSSNAWLEIGRNYSITATPASGFVVTNWTISTNWLGGVITNNATVQFMMESNLTLQVSFAETSNPILLITAPANLQKMTNALAAVTGTTSDKWGVAGVWYQLNNGAWNATATTNGWTNWTTTVELVSGTNTVKAYARNWGGNLSPTNPVSMVSSNTFKLQLAFTNAVPLETNGLVFSLELSTGLNGHIQVSTNLTSWATLTNFVGTNATLNFRDPAATNYNQRFYRAVIP